MGLTMILSNFFFRDRVRFPGVWRGETAAQVARRHDRAIEAERESRHPPKLSARVYVFPLSSAISMIGFVALFYWIQWIFFFMLSLSLWFVAAALFVVWYCQEFLLYLPSNSGNRIEGRQVAFNAKGFRSPEEYGLPYTDVYLDVGRGVQVHGWLITQDEPLRRPTVLYLHGNAGNIGHRLGALRELYVQAGVNIFIIDYRGYGNSGGSPSEKGLVRDAQAALDYLAGERRIDGRSVVVFVRSLGGAVAIAVASNPRNEGKLCALVLENTFTRIVDMASLIIEKVVKSKRVSAVKPFLRYYVTNPWRSIDRIAKVRVPTLFYSGLQDKLVPPAHMQALFRACSGSPKFIEEVKDGEHNNTVEACGRRYFERLREFMAQHASAPPRTASPPAQGAPQSMPSVAIGGGAVEAVLAGGGARDVKR